MFFESISSFDTKHFTVNEPKTSVSNKDSESFAVLHLNIRSMRKNFEIFQEFFKDLKFNLQFKTFNAIFLSEIWCESIYATKNSNYRLNGYRSFHQIRKRRKGGGLCIFKVHHKATQHYLRNNCKIFCWDMMYVKKGFL